MRGHVGQARATTFLALIDAHSGFRFSQVCIVGLLWTTALPSPERYVVVVTSASSTRGDIVFLIFDDERHYAEQRFVTLHNETNNEPAVVALPDGGFVIVWDEDTNARLEGQRCDAASNTVGTLLLLASGNVAALE